MAEPDLVNPAEQGQVPAEQQATASSDEIRRMADHGLKSLFFFAKGILGMKDLDPEIHGPICRILEEEGNRNIGVVLPRTWLKSSLVTIAYPIWKVARNRNHRILIVQNTASNAARKANAIDMIFKLNAVFKACYPDMQPSKQWTWRSDCMTVPRTSTDAEGSFEFAGVRTAVVSRHYDEIIEDDTVAPDYDELGIENIVPTKEDIDLAIGWHRQSTPLFVNQKTARSIIVGTRWFEVDLISWVRANEDYVWYERAVRETNGKADEHGRITWPSRFDDQVLTQIFKKMGPYMFSCLYLNKPVNSSTQKFQLEWFQYYEKEEDKLVVTTTVDPGGDPEESKGEVDFNVVCTTGKSLRTGRIFVLEIVKGQWNPGELLDELFRQVRKWHPVKVGIEAVAYQRTLMYWSKEKMKAVGLFFKVEPLTHGRRSKGQRIMGLVPLISSGMLVFRHYQQELISELIAFPNAAHDDLGDALALHLPLWRLTVGEEEEQGTKQRDPMSFDTMIEDIEQEQERKAEAYNPCFTRIGGLPIEDVLDMDPNLN